MEKSLLALLITALILGAGSAAFGQGYYGGAYQGQTQNYGQYSGQPNYQQQYAQPGQYNQHGRAAQPGVGYYQSYQDYMGAGRQPGYAAANPGLYYPPQAYPNRYNRQQSQPNPYYGVPQYQRQRGYPQTSSRPAPTASPAPMTTTRAAAVPASRADSQDPFSLEEKASKKAEIYWDPRQDQRSNPGLVSSQAPQALPAVRRESPAPRPRVVRPREPQRRAATTAPVKRRSLTWGKESKPPSKRAMKWGKKEPQAPAARTMKWGKDSRPAAVVSEPGSRPGVAARSSSRPTAQVRVQPKETGKPFKWGKTN